MTKVSTALLAGLLLAPLGFGSCTDGTPLAPDGSAAVDAAAQKIQGNGVSPVLPMRARTTGMLVGMMPAPEGRCPEHLPMLVSFLGGGNATHMGKVAVEGSECLYMDPSDPTSMASGAGKYTLTAANGDRLYIAYDQTAGMPAGPDSPWVLWSADIHATGGTGRFENAEMVETVWRGGVNLLTNETWAVMAGGIRLR